MTWIALITLGTVAVVLAVLVTTKDAKHAEDFDAMLRSQDSLIARVLQQAEQAAKRHAEIEAQREAAHDARVERLITALLEPDERLSIAKLEIEAHKAVAIAESKAKVAEHIGPAEVARRLEAERYAERYEDVGAER